MKENIYVDNLISRCKTSQVTDYCNKPLYTMAQGKFNFRSCATNSEQLRSQAAKDPADEKKGEVDILGFRWDPMTKRITTAQNSSDLTQQIVMTKPTILQQTAKVYDPLGLITPVTPLRKIPVWIL